jgi:hypothetical protein
VIDAVAHNAADAAAEKEEEEPFSSGMVGVGNGL